MAKSKALEKAGIPEVPAYISKYGEDGKGLIHKDELLIPRIILGQAMTAFVKEGKAKEGDFIDTITGVPLCQGDDTFNAAIVAKKTEYVLWQDRQTGGGVFDRAREVEENGVIRYKWDRPNKTYEDKLGGKMPVTYETKEYIDEDGLGLWGSQIPGDDESPPAATCHLNYIFALIDHELDCYAVSLSRTAFGRGKLLNTLLNKHIALGRPIWAPVITVSSTQDQKGDDIFANWNFVANSGFVGEDQAEVLHELYASLSDKTVGVQEEDRPDE